jgi:lactate dehydrogenase-like 2-hydroxyacid dehydrogenase
LSLTLRRRLYCSFEPPDSVREMLKRRCEVRFPSSDRADRGSLAQCSGDAEALMVAVTDDLSSEVVGSLPPSLRAILAYSVGHDHIDLGAAAARGIAVLNTPDVLSTAVAENAIFLMLAVARRATESISLVRSGSWHGWSPTQLLGFELRGKSLGILGLGGIGREVARRAIALDMKVTYHNRHPATGPRTGAFSFEPDLQTFLGELDILVLTAPSTPNTRRILNARTIALLKSGAIVINIARGDLVDDDALISALTSGSIRGAGLDVLDGEPDFDKRYLDLPNVFVLPHIGSSTIEARAAMAEVLLDGLDAIGRGERPPNQLV